MKQSKAFLRPVISNSRSVIGFVIVVIWFVIAIVVGIFPALIRYEPFQWNISNVLQPPSLENFFGTDMFGRSIFKMVLAAIPLDATVSVTVVSVTVVVGGLVGALAGYLGGVVEEVVMRITDMFLGFPPLVLAIGISAALGSGALNAMLALMVVGWTGYARYARGDTLGLRDQAFVKASKLSGRSTLFILRKHILPNIAPTLMAVASPDMGFVLINFSVLGYLGLGPQPPTVELGALVFQGQMYLRTAPGLSLIPGGVILAVSMGFSFLADGLRDLLDPSKRIA